MRKVSTSLCIGFLAIMVLAMPAAAGRTWCRVDPIVSLNSKSVQILIAIPADKQSLVTGALSVQIKTPKGVARTVTFSDSSAMVAADGAIPMEITAKTPINKQLSGGGPIEMEVTVIFANGSSTVFYGTSDNTLAKTTVPGR